MKSKIILRITVQQDHVLAIFEILWHDLFHKRLVNIIDTQQVIEIKYIKHKKEETKNRNMKLNALCTPYVPAHGRQKKTTATENKLHIQHAENDLNPDGVASLAEVLAAE